MLPPGCLPSNRGQRWFYGWRDDGAWQRVNHYFVQSAGIAQDSEASLGTGVIDSQSVKTTEGGGARV